MSRPKSDRGTHRRPAGARRYRHAGRFEALRVGLILLLLAAPAGVSAASPTTRGMGFDAARQLLTRAGFGADPASIRRTATLSRSEAVAALLRPRNTTAATPPPSWVDDFDSPRGLPRAARREWAERQRRRIGELSAWWLSEMLTTASPLTERMTLFWHSHFATSARKVRSAHLMYRQNLTLRRHALGRFDALLRAMSRDAALLFYLDAQGNRVGTPNENLARELMELFTLGPGHHTQRDVSEAARALTGLGIDPRDGRVRRRPRLHDAGVKEILGHRGRLDADDVVELLLRHPATASHLVEKLWREFISPDPPPGEVAAIATRFRASGYDLRIALGLLLGHDALYADAARGSLLKSPVELTVGTLRTLRPDGPLPEDLLRRLVTLNAALGQALFAPPDVKGWRGGEAWLDASSLGLRQRFLERVAGAAPSRRDTRPLDPALPRILLPLPGTDPAPGGSTLTGLLLDPVYQLR